MYITRNHDMLIVSHILEPFFPVISFPLECFLVLVKQPLGQKSLNKKVTNQTKPRYVTNQTKPRYLTQNKINRVDLKTPVKS